MIAGRAIAQYEHRPVSDVRRTGMPLSFTSLVILGAVGVSCDRNTRTTSPQAPVESELSDKPSGTLLRIICDIPGELGKPERSCPSHIGWSTKNMVRGQVFSLKLGQETVEVPLQHVIPLDAEIHIRFVVEEDPPFKSKFMRGDWFYYPRAREEASAKVFTVALSRFKKHDESRAKTMAPSED